MVGHVLRFRLASFLIRFMRIFMDIFLWVADDLHGVITPNFNVYMRARARYYEVCRTYSY